MRVTVVARRPTWIMLASWSVCTLSTQTAPRLTAGRVTGMVVEGGTTQGVSGATVTLNRMARRSESNRPILSFSGAGFGDVGTWEIRRCGGNVFPINPKSSQESGRYRWSPADTCGLALTPLTSVLSALVTTTAAPSISYKKPPKHLHSRRLHHAQSIEQPRLSKDIKRRA